VKEKLAYGMGFYEKGKYCSKVMGKRTREYTKWMNMLERCYSIKYNERNPTYRKCIVSNNFLNFQYFAEWCNNQVGFSEDGWHLDKDILVRHNHLYSEDNCVFVPQQLNCLLFDNNSTRGKYPIGVYFHSKRCAYEATVSVAGKKRHIGYYSTAEDAFAAYKEVKETYVKSVAVDYKNRVDSRVYQALLLWEVQDNLVNHNLYASTD